MTDRECLEQLLNNLGLKPMISDNPFEVSYPSDREYAIYEDENFITYQIGKNFSNNVIMFDKEGILFLKREINELHSRTS